LLADQRGTSVHHGSPRIDTKFGEDPAQVGGDCPFADMKLVSDLFIQASQGHKPCDLEFAFSQQFHWVRIFPIRRRHEAILNNRAKLALDFKITEF
jgi:hypothetical protein